MGSQDKWYVNKDGVDTMDVIIRDALTYPEGRALKCIIKGKIDDARVYLSLMEDVRKSRLELVASLMKGFELGSEQERLLERWKELI